MDAKEPVGKDSFTATSDQLVKCGEDGARYMESWGFHRRRPCVYERFEREGWNHSESTPN